MDEHFKDDESRQKHEHRRMHEQDEECCSDKEPHGHKHKIIIEKMGGCCDEEGFKSFGPEFMKDKFKGNQFKKMRDFGHPFWKPEQKITKLFTDKAEMIAFVNLHGEEGATIDIYKIDETLYKVEILKFKKEKKEE